MKTEAELNVDILKITGTIKDKYPELSKYIGEMPVKISYTRGDEDPNIKSLKEHYSSLEEIIKNYSKTHKEQ
ncbi:MAG: hypothetical protein H0U95_16675 [Bacteroidetes bacterium]|nr:hypothetical protein [Bacteroidota bacterium]